MSLRGPELAAHVRRGMEVLAREAGYIDANAMCRRLAREGRANLAAPAVVAADVLAALRAELVAPVSEYRGPDDDTVTARRLALLREAS